MNTVTFAFYNANQHSSYDAAKTSNAVSHPSRKSAWVISANDTNELTELAAMYRDFSKKSKLYGFVYNGQFYTLEKDDVATLINEIQNPIALAA